MSRFRFRTNVPLLLGMFVLTCSLAPAQKSVTPLQTKPDSVTTPEQKNSDLDTVPVVGKWLGRLELGPSQVKGTVSIGDAQNLAVSKAFLKQVKLNLVLKPNGDLEMMASGYSEKPRSSRGRWSRLGKVITLKVLEENGKPTQRFLQGFLADQSRFVVNLPNENDLPATKFVFRRGPAKAVKKEG